MIVPGALAGVAIAARALLRPGDRAVTESPTYPNAIATLTHSGARIVGVDVPPRGSRSRRPDHDPARRWCRRVAYLIPDFHNPTGRLMDADGRAAVARALGRTRTTAIVDESMVDRSPSTARSVPAPLAAFAPTPSASAA